MCVSVPLPVQLSDAFELGRLAAQLPAEDALKQAAKLLDAPLLTSEDLKAMHDRLVDEEAHVGLTGPFWVEGATDGTDAGVREFIISNLIH